MTDGTPPAIEVARAGHDLRNGDRARRPRPAGRRPAPCSGCSAPTAPARRRSSGSSPRCCARPPARGRCSVTTSSPTPLAVRRRIGLAGQFGRRRRGADRAREPRDDRPAVPAPGARGARSAPARCSSASGSPTPPTAACRPTRAACAGGSIWARACRAGHRCCCSTSRPPALTPARGWSCGASIDEMRRDGTTVLLTTQYLEEADRLAQRIARRRPRGLVAAGHPGRAQGDGRHRGARRPAGRSRADAGAARLLADLSTGDAPAVDRAAGEIRLAGRRPRGVGRGGAPPR